MRYIRPNALVIISRSKKLLVQKATDKSTGKSFFRLMGGGINFRETSLAALRRELQEELSIQLNNEKLLSVIENIFEFNGEPRHEITFLYSGDIADETLPETRIKILDKENEYGEWVAIQDIKDGKAIVYPLETVNYI